MVFMPNIKIYIARYILSVIIVAGFLTSNFPGSAIAQQTSDDRSVKNTSTVDTSSQEDEFSGLQSLSTGEMSQYSGGTEISLGDVGINLATNSSTLSGNVVDGNVVTGKIENLNLNDVGGINSLMLNTGNNVNFQSNILINIFVK